MTLQPEHHGTELIQRPALTPDALRAALTVVAPHRLPEMEQQKNEVFALAVESSSITPLRGFLATWAAHIEIARDRDTAARLRAAEPLVQSLDPGSKQWRKAVDDCAEIFDHAYAAVTA
nr:hypothetical protein [Streptomyces sp. 846.5]